MKVYARPLTAKQAAACEDAKHPRCRCRCGGAFHGAGHRGLLNMGGDGSASWVLWCPCCRERRVIVARAEPPIGTLCPRCGALLRHLGADGLPGAIPDAIPEAVAILGRERWGLV